MNTMNMVYAGKKCWHCEKVKELKRRFEEYDYEVLRTHSAMVNVSASKFCYAFGVISTMHNETSDVTELLENCAEILVFLRDVLNIRDTRVMVFSGERSYLRGRKEHQHAWIVMDSDESRYEYNRFLTSVMWNNPRLRGRSDFKYDGFLPALTPKELKARMCVETEPYKGDVVKALNPDESNIFGLPKGIEYEKEFTRNFYMFLTYRDATFVYGVVSHA
jgi:hypothetical protein